MNDFKLLIKSISETHKFLQSHAVNAVNMALTARNWLIGLHIVEYEQNGEDRAKYGSKLLFNIAKQLKSVKGLDERSLRNFRRFYQLYPQIQNSSLIQNTLRGTIAPTLENFSIRGSLTTESGSTTKIADTDYSQNRNYVPGDVILKKLSYTHLELLTRIDDSLKRTFYEIECIKGVWSVRELKRQINSLYFERSGLSKNPVKLSQLAQQKTAPQISTDIIKNVYAFEFLDLDIKEVVEESDLEKALLNNLQNFILELGNGFCFEARQKRIIIGEKYYYIDLVFYHRILKCHVVVELKIGEFEHGDIGQLNTYLNYYKENICETNDNSPVGILLVADKDHALVKYATAGMDENLFVQQYLIQLPSKEQLENYINQELKNLG